jgi:hypothetical protein
MVMGRSASLEQEGEAPRCGDRGAAIVTGIINNDDASP